MIENWLPVVGYEGCYEVSDQGRVRSLARYVRVKNGVRRVNSRILKSQYDGGGYPMVGLWKDYKGKSSNIHVLIATAFLGDPPIGYEVAHLDGDKTNSKLTNLVYTTCKQNHEHKKLHGTYTYGETHSRAKLTETNVKDIDILLGLGASQGQLAKKFGVSQSAISLIKRRINWAHLP